MTSRALGSRTLWTLFALFLFMPRAEAQVEQERVVVVVEAPAGVEAGEGVRLALSKQTGARISSLGESTSDEAPPRVIVTILGSKSGVINVLYWDVTGRVDALSASASASVGAGAGERPFELVATTLASALLQRNLPRLAKGNAQAKMAACDWVDLVAELRVQAAYSARPRHRTFPISIEDF